MTLIRGDLILSAPVAAEVDYMLGVRLGQAARRAFLEDLAARRYEVAGLAPSDYATVASLDFRYADLKLGLSDCGVVVLTPASTRSASSASPNATSARSNHSRAGPSSCCRGTGSE